MGAMSVRLPVVVFHVAAFCWFASVPCAVAVEPEHLLGSAPRYERVNGSIETVWQRPLGDTPPKGVFFIAHGCQHQGTDIFTSGGPDGLAPEVCKASNVGKCFGLPEEVKLRHAALTRGYVAMAVSGGRGSKSCWQAGDEKKVREAVKFVLQKEGLSADTPVLASGASSGGDFMGLLARDVNQGGLPNLVCIVPQIMDIEDSLNRGVPTLFVHMPRDVRTATAVRDNLDNLRKRGVRAEEIEVKPLPVTADLLSPCLPPDLAKKSVATLHEHRILDAKGFQKQDSRQSHWRQLLRDILPPSTLVPDEGCVSELMNVAYARHEFTSQYAHAMVDFCEKEGVGGTDSKRKCEGASGGSLEPGCLGEDRGEA